MGGPGRSLAACFGGLAMCGPSASTYCSMVGHRRRPTSIPSSSGIHGRFLGFESRCGGRRRGSPAALALFLVIGLPAALRRACPRAGPPGSIRGSAGGHGWPSALDLPSKGGPWVAIVLAWSFGGGAQAALDFALQCDGWPWVGHGLPLASHPSPVILNHENYRIRSA